MRNGDDDSPHSRSKACCDDGASSSTSLKKTLGALALGQLLSFLLASTGLTSTQLTLSGIKVPTTQTFLNYVLLAFVFGTVMLYRRKPPKVSYYWYMILALVDVEANFLVVKAYQYTSLTSVMLLDRGSLLFVLALTWVFLKAKYTKGQLCGATICVGGILILIFSDMKPLNKHGPHDNVLGDVLVIIGSLLYASSNVMEEYFVKSSSQVELMAFLGCFGALISLCQLLFLELRDLKTIHLTQVNVFSFLGYTLSLFAFYVLVPTLLKIGGSTLLNLSLLTSDMWALLFRHFLFHQKIHYLYFVALGVTIIGLIMYTFMEEETTMIISKCEENDEGCPSLKMNIVIHEQIV